MLQISVSGLAWLLGLSVLACLVTLAVMPWLTGFALRNGLVDRPSHRKRHPGPTPACGGVALFLGLLPMFAGLLALSLLHAKSLEIKDLPKILSLSCACAWILLLGMMDDKKGLQWSLKLVGQAVGVGILALGGHTIRAVTVPVFGVVTFGWLGIVVFGLLLIAITNAINLIDGLDGLAAGICLFAGIAGGCTALIKGDPLVAILQFSVVGALLGFLPYNWPPAKVFLGDGGSMMLGFYLGTVAMSSAAVSTPGQRSAMFTTLVAPFLPFSIALLDVVLSIVRRWLRGRKIHLPDADHLHHRLATEFHSPVLVNVVVYSFSAVLAGMAVLTTASPGWAASPIIPIAVLVLLTGLTVILLRTYRVDPLRHLPRVFAERAHYKFLDLYADFMTARIARAKSVSECLALLESGVRDLQFDSVILYHGNTPVRRWYNPTPVHLGSPRTILAESISGSSLLVKAVVPEHERKSYNDTLVASWNKLLNAFSRRLRAIAPNLDLELTSLHTEEVEHRPALDGVL